MPCQYPGRTISFHVEQGSNSNYLAVLIEYEDGEGDLNMVELMEGNSRNWVQMKESWGAIYRMDTNRPLHAPFSIRMTDDKNRKLVARNAIPVNWRPNTFYRSVVQYS